MIAALWRRVFAGVLASLFCAGSLVSGREVVNEVTGLHPVVVGKVVKPTSVGEIVRAVKATPGPISIGGARHSQGGQIAANDSLHLDLRGFDRILSIDVRRKLITVQSGVTWRNIQEQIDKKNLSVSIMQSYANFTVGGSLSVNCHGRYVGAGPIISSVKSIRVVLADGRVVKASPHTRPDIFYAAIGGYGGIGVIVEVTLQLTDNTRVKRESHVMPVGRYPEFFNANIRGSRNAVFHNADVYPPGLGKVRAITWSETDEEVTIPARLVPRDLDYGLERWQISFVAGAPFSLGKFFREYVAAPILFRSRPVVWRNYEASLDTDELEPRSREKKTDVLQEYFVPVNRFDEFYPAMARILKRHRVNVLNISIRHAARDPGSKLAWARDEVFAFVLYYRQGTSKRDRRAVGVWTRELIEAALSAGGTYYLPYQVQATPEQFRRAYPGAAEFFSLKRKLDPANKFRNKLWDAYYPARR